MADRKGLLWQLVSGTMELSWFFGWAMFCSLLTMHRPFPFLASVAAFSLAVAVTGFSLGKGWRIATVLGIELSGFAGGTLLILHGLYGGSYPLSDPAWPGYVFGTARSVLEWFVFSLNILLIVILWAAGAALARRPKDYYRVCGRFDFGIAAFFALFLIKLIALTHGEMLEADNLSLFFVFPFFLSGLVAIGMARTDGAVAKTFLSGYRGIGVITSFVAFIMLGTGLLFLFFLPGLTAAARAGQGVLAAVGRQLAPVLIAILRFAFGPRDIDSIAVATQSPSSSFAADAGPQSQGWFMELLEKILSLGFMGMMILALVAVLAIAFFYTTKWLLSRTAKQQRETVPLRTRLRAFLALLAGLGMRLYCVVRGYRRAAGLFGALERWGGRSGVLRRQCETTLEFGARLKARFPTLRKPVETIIDAYNRETYGVRRLDAASLAEANAAWRLLRSPLRWPLRFCGWLAGAAAAEKEI